MAVFSSIEIRNFLAQTEKVIEELQKKHPSEKFYFCTHEGHLTIRRGVYADWPGQPSAAPAAVMNWRTEKWSICRS